MWFAYIDESKEPGKFYAYSALITTGDRWASTFEKLKDFRKDLRRDHGVFLAYELHAWKFVPGRGRPANRPLYKDERAEIFRKTLAFIAECKCFVAVGSVSRTQEYALQRLVQRIQNTAKARGENALLFFDDGDAVATTRILRKMRYHNPIPSNRRSWSDTGHRTKNIPMTNILEDPIFKDSAQSYFIQLVDFCAYALLRQERPLASRNAYGIGDCYELLRPISRPFTNRSDPRRMGIIRDKA
jgi:hypothetical protein